MDNNELITQFHAIVHPLREKAKIKYIDMARHPDIEEAVKRATPRGNRTTPYQKFRQWTREEPTSIPTEEVIALLKQVYAEELQHLEEQQLYAGISEINRQDAINTAESLKQIEFWKERYLKCEQEKERLWKLLNNKD